MNEKKLATIISHLFSAPVFSIYCLIPIVFKYKLFVLSIVFLSILFLSVFPVIYIIFERARGKIDIFVSKLEDRPKFFVPALLSYFTGYLYFELLGISVLSSFLLCYFTVSLATFLVSIKWKISIHMAGSSGPLAFIYMLFGPLSLPSFLVLPLIAWARIKLGAHTLMQCIAGTLLSIIITILTLLL